MAAIPAAGTIPWRERRGTLEVALVHRPRYDDWSWAKGKLDPGEEWAVAAARETLEETGLVVHLGRPLPATRYPVVSRTGERSDKVVHYWAARVHSGHGRTEHEVDEVAWLEVQRAYDRLDYARDRDQLLAVVRAHHQRTLDTWPLALVRHAKALPRSSWRRKDDTARPLDPAGLARARALAPLLAAYGISRLLTSPSTRCTESLAPYAAWSRHRLVLRPALSEEGYAVEPEKARALTARVLAKGAPAAVCTHGPVLPDLVDLLVDRLDRTADDADDLATALRAAGTEKLVKGEVLLCHVAGTGEHARVVAVERHLP
ncbi:MAG TPA: NUDIX hydrolase [Dermatophilaceae bacterium]|nr:NUDIX hydrolase [Dermatophilaceae bacterium]